MSSSHTKNSISFLLFSINKAQSWIDLRAGNVPYFIWQCTVYLDEIIIEEGSSPSIATNGIYHLSIAVTIQELWSTLSETLRLLV